MEINPLTNCLLIAVSGKLIILYLLLSSQCFQFRRAEDWETKNVQFHGAPFTVLKIDLPIIRLLFFELKNKPNSLFYGCISKKIGLRWALLSGLMSSGNHEGGNTNYLH